MKNGAKVLLRVANAVKEKRSSLDGRWRSLKGKGAHLVFYSLAARAGNGRSIPPEDYAIHQDPLSPAELNVWRRGDLTHQVVNHLKSGCC